MRQTFKEEIIQFWTKSLKSAISTIKEKFCKVLRKNETTKSIKPKKSVRKKITLTFKRKTIKSKPNTTRARIKLNNVLDQTVQVVKESEAEPLSVEILKKKESTLHDSVINDILKENEINKEKKNISLLEEERSKKLKTEKNQFYKRIVQRIEGNDLKKNLIERKLKLINCIDSNNYIPKIDIPEINHGDEMSLELAFDMPVWAKNPKLTELVEKQDHDFLESKFNNCSSVDIVSIFPKIKNLSNDSPNKWNKN